ncbi:MAG: hypothetical protein LBH25_04425 [Fibromonadaceae bacterium]|jgi:hypothetical protein|nr:hypothetical protein [Fibromonadaceae bacterium]
MPNTCHNKIIIIFLLFFAKNSFCHSPDAMSISFLPIGYSILLSDSNQIKHELNFAFYGISLEDRSGFGFEHKFPQYYYLFDKKMISFINLGLYWNLLSSNSYETLMLGQFTSMNFINWYIKDNFNPTNCILDMGLRFSYRDFMSHILVMRIGNEIVNGLNRYYFTI